MCFDPPKNLSMSTKVIIFAVVSLFIVVGIVVLHGCDSSPTPVKAIPAAPKPVEDITPKVDQTRTATLDAGTKINTASSTVATATAAIRTDLASLNQKHPEIVAEPESKSIPSHVDDIDRANALIADQAKVIASMAQAFDGINKGVGAIKDFAAAQQTRADAAVGVAKDANDAKEKSDKALASAEKQLHDRDTNIARIIAGIIMAIAVGWAAFSIIVIKSPSEAFASVPIFAIGLTILWIGENLYWLKWVGAALVGVAVLAYASYKFNVFKSAITDLVQTIEYFKGKLPAGDRVSMFGDNSHIGKIDQKAIQSPTTQKIVDTVRATGAVILAPPLTVTEPDSTVLNKAA